MHQLGARSFEFDLDTGQAIMLPAIHQSVSVRAAQEAVADAGFELLSLDLELLGQAKSLTDSSGSVHFALYVESLQQSFILEPSAIESEREAWKRLTPLLAEEHALLRVRGHYRSDLDLNPVLNVTAFRIEAAVNGVSEGT